MITGLIFFAVLWGIFCHWLGDELNYRYNSFAAALTATCLFFLPVTLYIDIVGALK